MNLPLALLKILFFNLLTIGLIFLRLSIDPLSVKTFLSTKWINFLIFFKIIRGHSLYNEIVAYY